nr:UDP-glucosyltransferase 7 [Isatis tinctoria]
MEQPHALLVASPGLGHLIPILELGNRLSSVLNIHVTVLAVPSGSSSSPTETEAIRAAVARGTCEIAELPSVDIEHLVEPDATVATRIFEKMRATRPAVQDAVKAMNRKPTVMIVDFFATGLMSVADDVGVTAKYVYVPSHAWFLAVMVYLPVLDKVVEGEYIDIKEPMKIPGCRSVGPDELMDTMFDRSDRQYRECVRCGEEIPMSDGILVNTWEELQGNTLAALREDGELSRVMKVPVYAIGPFVRSNGPIEKPKSIFEWLDKQRDRSVVYVCLGSGGILSLEQTMELAWGLELSGQSFLWVLRRPTSYLEARSSDDDQVSAGLPEGFLDRTRGVGLVVTQWAPQVEILSHGSIGGFLSHCGWSSVLESLTKGVPIVAWPLYAEQWMNATLLTEEIGVAVRTSELPSKKVIGREEVASLVRKIVAEEDEEGRKVRAKAEEVKATSEAAWAQGGSSHGSLLEWAKRCRLVCDSQII